MRRIQNLFLTLALLLGITTTSYGYDFTHHTNTHSTVSVSMLPPEAQTTLSLIQRGGPFPYPRDGIVFQNREHILPPHPKGYYHEYTVTTPGASNRGTRRIISGNVGEYYYTQDHYQSFQRITQ
jgi:ribonuclease T1